MFFMSNQTKNIQASPNSRREYMEIFYYKNKLRYILAIVTLIILCLMELFVANIMQLLTDVAVEKNMEKLVLFILLSILYIIVLSIMQTVHIKTKFSFVKKAMYQYKKKTFSKISEKNVSSFHKENTGSYISSLTNDVNSIETNYLFSNLDIIKNILLVIGALFMMFYYDWTFTIVVVISSFFPLIVSTLLGNRIIEKEKIVSNQNEIFVSLVKDLLSGFSVIKGFRAEREVTAIFLEKTKELEDAKYKRRMVASIVGIIATILSFIAEIIVFIYGAWLAINGNISVGVMIAFIQLMNYIIGPVSQLPTLISNRKSALALMDKFILLSSYNQIKEGKYEIEKVEQDIVFDHVQFGYSDEDVLKDINVRFEKGNSYAIVGSSGSGKSTLLNMILGSFDNYRGKISIDNIDLKDIKRSSLYNVVSMVQQNVFIFNDSIIDNITMFKDFEQSKIMDAILQSGLKELVKEKGDHYLCGENGVNLSGGEKQRISIARGLLKGASVLLLDEATSALDTTIAKNIENAILDIDGVTRIVVTHRLDKELLRRYNKIIVMRNGRIEEIGNLKELLERKSYFYELLDITNEEDSSITKINE